MQKSITNKIINARIDDELDRIVLYMISEPGTIPLNEREMNRYKRIQYAYDHLALYSDSEVKQLLINDFEINRSTAYQDIADAYAVHNRTKKPRRELEIDYLLQQSKEFIRSAFASGDLRMMGKAIEAKARVLALLPPDSQNDLNNYAPHNYYIIINQGAGADPIKIQFSDVHTLPAPQFEELQQRLLNAHLDETIEILDKYDSDEQQV